MSDVGRHLWVQTSTAVASFAKKFRPALVDVCRFLHTVRKTVFLRFSDVWIISIYFGFLDMLALKIAFCELAMYLKRNLGCDDKPEQAVPDQECTSLRSFGVRFYFGLDSTQFYCVPVEAWGGGVHSVGRPSFVLLLSVPVWLLSLCLCCVRFFACVSCVVAAAFRRLVAYVGF